MSPSNVFLGYDHGKGDFQELTDTTKYQSIIDGDLTDISRQLSSLG
ncbi:MAG: hypothetical protein H7646_13235, partial [Candidatus Heimdallarchaeota archaeon]|nr:hypothetical protein [Candidatus Heimdallarchaeota archaeon]